MVKLRKKNKLWYEAIQIIPGGNGLLSKRPERFLPEYWPTYYKKAKGCFVWDLENKKYTDMSIMGIGTNILGYGNEYVDEQVIKAIKFGNMSTLNCPEEVELAEQLIKIHPWANMVKFARSGGEANSIAVRIARAFSGKDKVIFCGYINDPFSILEKTDLVVIPSLTEGTSRTALEALYLGIPCIMRNTSGNNELITGNSMGLLFDDDNDLYLKMIDIYKKKARYNNQRNKSLLQESNTQNYCVNQLINKINNVGK